MASRTYSGSRIRISDHQAALISKMVAYAMSATPHPDQHHIRWALRDLQQKVIAQANRHQLEAPRERLTTDEQAAQASSMWATPAGDPEPGRRDVGHNAGLTTGGR